MSLGISAESDYLIAVLRSLLRGESAPAPEASVDLSRLYALAEAHGVSCMAYFALCHIDLPSNALKPFAAAHDAYVRVGMMQEVEYSRISAAMSAEGIDHMPLKGWRTRELYPEPLMRSMGDVDILIRTVDSPAACRIIERLGYHCSAPMKHDDDMYFKNGLLMELHRTLDADGLKNPHYYDDPWRFAVADGGENSFAMSDEDGYLYTVAHAMKHFMNCGTGLRSILDVYVYITRVEMDRSIIERDAELMGITRFLRCVESMAVQVFGDETPTADTIEIMRFVLASGTAGNSKNLEAAFMNKSGGKKGGSKLTYAVRIVFPPFSDMKKRDPVLEKAPYLLPIMYVWRWFQLVFCKRGRIKSRVGQYRSVDKEYAAQVKRVHELAGID